MSLDSHKLLAGAGVPADAINFNEYVQKNMKLYELNNDLSMTTKSAANFIRREVRILFLIFALYWPSLVDILGGTVLP